MTKDPTPQSSAELDQILESAHRLGVEIDEEEAIQWLTAMAAANAEDDDIIVDIQSGVFGHRVSMLDFSPDDLAHFRKIGELVEFKDVPDQVETALALSGSAAQSKIQAYPGDADYFERVNIIADSREEACSILAKIMRDKALSTEKGATYQLIEVKFGNYPLDVIKDGEPAKYGSPISWTPADIRAGQIDAFKTDGTPVVIDWEQVAVDPGWCKLDWVIADTVRGQLSNASNMLDVTWEATDGKITPLDGYLDPYFQEVYLEAASVPIFSKLAKNVSGNALDDYVDQLEKEVTKYLTKDINYGKAAKRMYNIFRLIGKYEEAAFLRELFDEPTTMLYQVWSFIRTIDDCCNPETSINREDMLAHADNLIMSVITSLEGGQEAEVVRKLLRLRDALTRQEENKPLTSEAEAARAEVINIVNNFFYERLTAIPTIKAYMSEFE